MIKFPQLIKEVIELIERICTFLTNRIRKEMPEIDDERAEIINYGLQNIVGEIPKVFIMLGVAYFLGIFKLALFTFVALFPYKGASGGVHLKTHIGCILVTIMFYCGIPFVSQYFVFTSIVKYIIVICVWMFGIIMIKLYAPADTESVPILEKIVSYATFTLGLLIAVIIDSNVISNILILANFIQTIMITKFVYKLTNNKYGYEVYENTSTESV